MKRKQFKILGVAVLAMFTLAGCGSSQKAEGNSDKAKTENTQKKEKKKTEETSSTDPNYSNPLDYLVDFKSIKDGKTSDEIYNAFIKGVKDDPDYGNDPMQNQNLTVILYKPNCPDCKKAESFIVSKVKENYLSAPLQMKVNMKVDDYKYNVVAVDISKEVPQWVKDVNGLADESGQYHTPTVAVITPKRIQEGLQWDVMNVYHGTDEDQIRLAMTYYGIENASTYKAYMTSPISYDPQKSVK